MRLDTPAALAQTSRAQPAAPPSPWVVLAVTSLGVLLTFLNSSTLEVALPAVGHAYHASPLQANWILLLYMLVNTPLILVFGRLADLFGRRRLYMAGLAIFTLASLGCGAAPNAAILILMRGLQAVGAASIITNTTPLLTDVFPPRLLSRALGTNAMVASISQVLGPLIGGIIATTIGGRGVFLFNVPLGLLGLALGARYLPHPTPTGRRSRFDLPGAALSALALFGLLYGLSSGGAKGWTDPSCIAGFLILAAAAPAFVITQLTSAHPLVDPHLLRHRQRGFAYLAVTAQAAAQFGVVLLVAFFLQVHDGMSGTAAALCVVPMAIGMTIGAPLCGRLGGIVPVRVLATGGSLLTCLGLLILLAALTSPTAAALRETALFCIGLGMGCFMTPNTTSIMASVEPTARGTANGLRSMLQNSGAAISAAVVLAVSTSALSPTAKHAAFAGHRDLLDPQSLAAFAAGSRLAVLCLFGTCLIAAALSWSRGQAEPHR